MNLSKIVLFVEGGNVLEGDIDFGISVRGLIWVLAGLSSRLCLSLSLSEETNGIARYDGRMWNFCVLIRVISFEGVKIKVMDKMLLKLEFSF